MNTTVNESLTAITNVASKMNPLLSRLSVAILILLAGFIIGKLVGNIIQRALIEIRIDKYLRLSGLKFSLSKFISKLISYIIYFIAIVMSLNSIGLTTAILNMISGAVILIIVISFILAVKDFFPNLIAGIRIKNNKMFIEGDEIQIKEVRGRIISLGLLDTRLLTIHKEEVIIPNAIFNKRQIVIRNKMLRIRNRNKAFGTKNKKSFSSSKKKIRKRAKKR